MTLTAAGVVAELAPERVVRVHAPRTFGALVATAGAGTMCGVPASSRFLGIVIAMSFDDHRPAHVHARHTDGSAKVRIDTLEVIESTMARRQLRFVLA